MEAETLGDTLSDAQALVDTLVASQAEVQEETLGDTERCAGTGRQLADSQAEVEAETLDDTQSDMQAMVDTVADSQAEV